METTTKLRTLGAYTLILDKDQNTFHICKTIKYLKGEAPKGISFFRGSFAECVMKIIH